MKTFEQVRITQPQVNAFYNAGRKVAYIAYGTFIAYMVSLITQQQSNSSNLINTIEINNRLMLMTLEQLNRELAENITTLNMDLVSNTTQNHVEMVEQIRTMSREIASNISVSTDKIVDEIIQLYNETSDILQILELFYSNQTKQTREIILALDDVTTKQQEVIDFLGGGLGEFVLKQLNEHVQTIVTENVHTLDFEGTVCEYDPLGFGPINCEGSNQIRQRLIEPKFE